MLLYQYQCECCELCDERLTKYEDEKQDIQICENCGDLMVRQVEIIPIFLFNPIELTEANKSDAISARLRQKG